MKLLAFTDPHESLVAIKEVEKKAKNAELLVCAGDISIFEQELDAFLARINKIGKTVLLIHGNHEGEQLTETLCQGLKNLVFIHKKLHRIGNYVFIGYGGGGFDEREPDFEKFIEKNIAKIKPDEKIVLITHGPPYGTRLDVIGKGHHGCKSYAKYIRILKPELYICGHFHETFGLKDKLGKTLIINPGPKGMLVEI